MLIATPLLTMYEQAAVTRRVGGSTQQATEALTADRRPYVVRLGRDGNDESVAQALMVAFEMIVFNELGDGSLERLFTDENYAIQAGFFDGPYEALGVCIGVSSRLHRVRAVRHKPSGLPIPFIPCMAGHFR